MNILGIDFEEWYHPELIQRILTTEKRSLSVVNGIDKIINFLQKHDVSATFFMVGELLEKKPELLDKILSNGHEIAFHTMFHSRLDSDGFKEKFSSELERFSLLTNNKSKGFRAPTFSLNEKSSWAIDILTKNGYVYDSSIVPAKTSMYGNSKAPKKPYKISSNSIEKNDPNASLIEFPLMVTQFLGKTIPSGGGFYLRTLPFKVTVNAMDNYEKQGIPAVYYIHSWEMTPEYMPKINLPIKDKFITYHNLNKALQRLSTLLENYQFTSFEKYLKNPN